MFFNVTSLPPILNMKKYPDTWDVSASDVLYEDDAIIVVNKPCGIPSQATLDPSRDHAYAAVKRYLHDAYCGLHHRLDVGTSGVLLMTKTQDANPSISEQFQKHTVRKTYTALACGTTQDEKIKQDSSFVYKAAIGEDKTAKIQKFCVGGKNRKHAETSILCQQLTTLRDGFFARFECQPLTGRTHQIRVHLASLGLPIIGDTLYNPSTLRSLRALMPDRMCLHAARLEFIHPISGEPMCVEAPLPAVLEKFALKASKLMPH